VLADSVDHVVRWFIARTSRRHGDCWCRRHAAARCSAHRRITHPLRRTANLLRG